MERTQKISAKKFRTDKKRGPGGEKMEDEEERNDMESGQETERKQIVVDDETEHTVRHTKCIAGDRNTWATSCKWGSGAEQHEHGRDG